MVVWTCLHDAALPVTWPTSVCRRRLRTVVASLALQSPGSSWCAGLGRLLASAVWLRMAPGPGTDYQRPSDHQNCHWLYSKRQLKSSLTSVDVRRLDVCLTSVPALDSAGCSCGRQFRRPALLWLYSEFGADYRCPDSTQLTCCQCRCTTLWNVNIRKLAIIWGMHCEQSMWAERERRNLRSLPIPIKCFYNRCSLLRSRSTPAHLSAPDHTISARPAPISLLISDAARGRRGQRQCPGIRESRCEM